MTRLVSTVPVVDLEAACAMYGHDTPPDPLGRTRPVGSLWLAGRDVGPISERLDGDLRVLRHWVEALACADVCLECRVHYSDNSLTDLRMHALRTGDSAFIAVQRPAGEVEAVELYAVSPDELSEAVAYSVGLVGAGTRPSVLLTEGAEPEYDDFGFPLPNDNFAEAAVTEVHRGEVAAVGTLRSRYALSRFRGEDTGTLRWVRLRHDGDYLCAPDDPEYAEPFSVETLHACVDGLIDRR